MTDLTQQIARLEKLDAERTPRFWMQELVKYHQIRDFGGALIAQTLLPRGDGRVDKANAEFIAAAPEMMAVIHDLWPRYQEQQRLLGLAVEGLELAKPLIDDGVRWAGDFYDMSQHSEANYHRQRIADTLAQLKPTEEV